MGKALRGSLVVALLLCAGPAHALDPAILKFLFSIAQDMAASAASSAIEKYQATPAPAPSLYPGTTIEPAVVRRLIDDSFGYLSEEKRDEIFSALHAELLKPANAAVRAPMIEFFTERALQ